MLRKIIAVWVSFSFLLGYCGPVMAQAFSVDQLPVAGSMVGPSSSFIPLALKGIVVDPARPLEFKFIVDTGNSPRDMAFVRQESDRLVKYFLAGLTIPDGDIWVNLSPYEKDRIITDVLGKTELGRDLLSQDYVLKQLTATLLYPEKELGKEFWARVYARAQREFGSSDIPVNAFNKVWIMADQAQVFENQHAAYVTKSTLKVMLDKDRLALDSEKVVAGADVSAQITREIILPEIEKEVNTGKNFAPLRQIYQALILAKWYRETVKNAMLEALYVDKRRTNGVDLDDVTFKKAIYDRYVESFRKGVFNYIKEMPGPKGEMVPQKYFSGGITRIMPDKIRHDGIFDGRLDGAQMTFDLRLEKTPVRSSDAAMSSGIKSLLRKITFTGVFLTLSAVQLFGQNAKISWMRNNVFSDGMPKSFEIPQDVKGKQDVLATLGGNDVDGIIERMSIANGLSIYDAAVWQIALSSSGGADLKATDILVKTLTSGRWGMLNDIRASQNFTYQGNHLSKGNAFFFRLLSPAWSQPDPKTGATHFAGFPGPGYDPNLIVWSDWKPVTGENAWVILGNLQGAYAANGGKIPSDSPELQLALSLIPAFEALTTKTGAVLYTAVAPKDPESYAMKDLISTENNTSAYAAFRALYQVTNDPKYSKMMDGIERYMKGFAWDAQHNIFYQGGAYNGSTFKANTSEFAVDCQTWPIIVFGPKKIDAWHGAGAAYKMWQATKSRAGYIKDGKLLGVGFTDGHDVLSGEWTPGAIAATFELALYYKDTDPAKYKEVLADALSMIEGMKTLKRVVNGRESYLYANKRTYIVFGWYGNPRPSQAATGWNYFLQAGFNPLVLGGKTSWLTLTGVKEALAAVQAAKGKVQAAVDPVLPGKPAAPSSGASTQSQGAQTKAEVKNKVIASSITGEWSGGGAYSVWAGGTFDLSRFTGLRITFPSSDAGVKVKVRVLRQGLSGESQSGLSRKTYTIPSSGVLEVPMADFLVTAADLKNIEQISVHSGSNAWGVLLNASANKQASFMKIEGTSEKLSGASLGAVKPATTGGASGFRMIAPSITGEWSNGEAASVWADGSFDFSKAKKLRITFPASQAGVKVLVRLLRQGLSENSRTGLSSKSYLIPSNGVVEIPVSDFEANGVDLQSKISQISVHSGTNAWGIPINSSYKVASFTNVAVSDNAMLDIDGGIDLNGINLNREGKPVVMTFDPAALNEILEGGFVGFTPVVINMTEVLTIKPVLDLFRVSPLIH